MADSRTRFTSSATRRGLNARAAIACSAVLQGINCASRFNLRGDTRMEREKARASLSPTRRGALFLLIGSALLRRRRRSDRGFFVSGMSVEGARRREFPELVADHVLGDQDRHMLMAIVHT